MNLQDYSGGGSQITLGDTEGNTFVDISTFNFVSKVFMLSLGKLNLETSSSNLSPNFAEH